MVAMTSTRTQRKPVVQKHRSSEEQLRKDRVTFALVLLFRGGIDRPVDLAGRNQPAGGLRRDELLVVLRQHSVIVGTCRPVQRTFVRHVEAAHSVPYWHS